MVKQDGKEPSVQEWVAQLSSVLQEEYMPRILDEVRSQLGPLVRDMLDELKPLILRMVQEEVRFQITSETVKRVRIVVDND